MKKSMFYFVVASLSPISVFADSYFIDDSGDNKYVQNSVLEQKIINNTSETLRFSLRDSWHLDCYSTYTNHWQNCVDAYQSGITIQPKSIAYVVSAHSGNLDHSGPSMAWNYEDGKPAFIRGYHDSYKGEYYDGYSDINGSTKGYDKSIDKTDYAYEKSNISTWAVDNNDMNVNVNVSPATVVSSNYSIQLGEVDHVQTVITFNELELLKISHNDSSTELYLDSDAISLLLGIDPEEVASDYALRTEFYDLPEDTTVTKYNRTLPLGIQSPVTLKSPSKDSYYFNTTGMYFGARTGESPLYTIKSDKQLKGAVHMYLVKTEFGEDLGEHVFDVTKTLG